MSCSKECPHGLTYGSVRCLNCMPFNGEESVLAPLSEEGRDRTRMDTLTLTLTPCPNCKRITCSLHATFITAAEQGYIGPVAGYLDAVNDCVVAMVNNARIATATLDAIRAKAKEMEALGITRSLENTVAARCGKEILDLLDRDY